MTDIPAKEFPELGQEFRKALLKRDEVKRHQALDEWKGKVIPALQAAVPEQIEKYIEWSNSILNHPDLWSEDSWYLTLNMKLELRRKLPQEPLPVQQETEASYDEGGHPLGGGNGSPVSSSPSPNDQRSDVMNPNNPSHHAASDNRSNQMNPNNPAYWSSHGGRGGRR